MAEQLAQQQIAINTLIEQNTSLNNNLASVSTRLDNAQSHFQETVNKIATLENQISILTASNAQLETAMARINNSDPVKDKIKRITSINPLKNKEPPSFTTKDNYTIWAEHFKNDIFASMPEVKEFLVYAEETPTLTPDMVKSKINNELATLIDNKLWLLLNNVTRNHAEAPSKLKRENPENLGTLAWHNL